MKYDSAEFWDLVNRRVREDIENLPEDKRPGLAGRLHIRTMAYKKVVEELRAKGQLED